MRDKLISFFENRLGVQSGAISDDTPIYSSGMLDSVDMVDVIMFIEEVGGIRLDPMDVTLDNLDSVDRIVRFVEQARSEAAR